MKRHDKNPHQNARFAGTHFVLRNGAGRHLALLFLLVFTFTTALHSQEIRLFTSADGLPGSQFTSLAKGLDGSIWSCHYGGLCWFDGSTFVTFRERRGAHRLRSNTVYKVFTDIPGQVWIATARGLQRYYPKTQRFEHVQLDSKEGDNAALSGKALAIMDIALLPDKKNLLICTGNDGFFVVDAKLNRLNTGLTRAYRNRLGGLNIRRMLIDSRNRIWLVSNKFWLYDSFRHTLKGIWMHPNQQVSSGSMEITDLLEDKLTKQVVIADNWNGVLVFDEKTGYLKNLSKKSPFQKAQCLLQRKDGTLLVGCETNGIGRIDVHSERVQPYPMRESPVMLNKVKIHDMTEDVWGNLYIGIYQKGLLVLPQQKGGFNLIPVGSNTTAANASTITSIVSSDDGKLYAGTDGDGVYTGTDPDRLHKIVLPPSCNASVQQLALEPDGTLWIATYGTGLFVRSKGIVKKFSSKSFDVAKNISCLQLDRQKRFLYVGTIGTGLWQINLRSGMAKRLPYGGDWIQAVMLDSNGQLWIGGSTCLCLNTRTGKLVSTNVGITNNSMVHAFLEVQDQILIGSSNGLFVYQKNSAACRAIPLIESGITTTVYSMLAHNKNVWISTNHGLIRYNLRNGSSFNYFGYAIKRIGDFHKLAACNVGDSLFIFGGDNGIIAFSPLNINNVHTGQTPVFINSLSVNGNPIQFDIQDKRRLLNAALPFAGSLKLPYQQNSVAIGFATGNYALNQTISFRYRLEGYEKNWHSSTSDNHLAVYTLLPPGTYRFHLTASFEGNGQTVSSRYLNIVVKAPWYWSWWSKSLYLVLLLLLLFHFYNSALQKQNSKRRIRDLLSEHLQIRENYQKLLLENKRDKGLEQPVQNPLKLKILEAIALNFAKPNFGVEALSNELALSRVHLYRKTMELFECSPNDLLRNYRMKQAGIKLIQTHQSIAEIAYQCGYSETSYFSKIFKNYFNMTPSAFIARYRDSASDETINTLFDL